MGRTVDDLLNEWEGSERRQRVRRMDLREQDGIKRQRGDVAAAGAGTGLDEYRRTTPSATSVRRARSSRVHRSIRM
ncbi:MAG: hypothetical protein R2867_30025 [Caldilineaceae bacterium]